MSYTGHTAYNLAVSSVMLAKGSSVSTLLTNTLVPQTKNYEARSPQALRFDREPINVRTP
ncbi:hypothetical protein BDR04DRAFT_1091331 [Suillus decipiens]|nr:hypothetical protein BDR04DRAFT_1091331 [Suillus decipiens]